jgi:hypothetical protein
MNCSTFYNIALPFIIAGSIGAVINMFLQYYDIILKPYYKNKDKPLTLKQFVILVCCKNKFKEK